MEVELNIKIQHRHLDSDNYQWVGDEHRPLEWQRKPVDGYYEDNYSQIAIEFLGDKYHGHPRLWKDDQDATNHFGIKHKDLYEDTNNLER